MDLLLRKLLYISVSLILYLASLALPAYNYSSATPAQVEGYESLMSGYTSVAYITNCANPFPFISWLANVPFIAGTIILVFARNKKTFKAASATLFVAMVMSLCSLILFCGTTLLFTPSIGCFVWMFSLLLMWAGAHLIMREFSEPVAE